MELTLKATNQRVRKKVERDFEWYNSYTKEVWRGRGGEMRFRYIPDLKYSIPYLVDAEDWVTQNNYDDIVFWVESKKLPVLNATRGFFISVEISPDDLDDLSQELYNKKIIFDWD
jgi:hypothetical protein